MLCYARYHAFAMHVNVNLAARYVDSPAALSHGIGSDSQRPFAIVIVSGLISDLVTSIFLLPTLYVWMAGANDVLPGSEAEFDEQA